jgi:hypothetical protein
MNVINGEETCDFLSYLEWRLGMKRDATAEMLGEWLTTYTAQRPMQLQLGAGCHARNVQT